MWINYLAVVDCASSLEENEERYFFLALIDDVGRLDHLLEGLDGELSPAVDGFVGRGKTVVGNVVGQEGQKTFDADVRTVFDIVLLGGDHGQVLLLLAAVLAEFDAAHHLFGRRSRVRQSPIALRVPHNNLRFKSLSLILQEKIFVSL